MEYQSDAVFWYIQELTSRIVAKTGIPTDRFHIGKILLRSFKDAPDHICQIDGATGEKETFQSVLERSVRCATAFRNLSLKFQDVVVIMAPNHLDLVIPMYASFYLGIIVAGVDMYLGVNELRDTFKRCNPKIVFCQSSNVEKIEKTLSSLSMPTQIVAYDENEDYLSFSKFLDDNGGDTAVKDFQADDFDAEDTIAMLFTTSGSVGLPKAAALTHKGIALGFLGVMVNHTKFPTPINMGLAMSPVQWVTSAFYYIMGPILRFSRVQTSSTVTQEHVCFLIEKYKPDFAFMSPALVTALFKRNDGDKCDFTCLQHLFIGGSIVHKELLEEVKRKSPNTFVRTCYGLTETTGMIFNSAFAPFGSVGSPFGNAQYKLTDVTTNEVVSKPNLTGELRLRGPSILKCYYGSPEMTAAAFDEDGWFKTGDLMYRDEYYNYYFVDRIKSLLKYRSNQISPGEIETVIAKHPDVVDVAVTGIPDPECGDLPVAVVIVRYGHTVTAQEIKDLVKDSLSDSKQLRGGVIFVQKFPTTSTSKLDRQKLKEFVLNLKKE